MNANDHYIRCIWHDYMPKCTLWMTLAVKRWLPLWGRDLFFGARSLHHIVLRMHYDIDRCWSIWMSKLVVFILVYAANTVLRHISLVLEMTEVPTSTHLLLVLLSWQSFLLNWACAMVFVVYSVPSLHENKYVSWVYQSWDGFKQSPERHI